MLKVAILDDYQNVSKTFLSLKKNDHKWKGKSLFEFYISDL